MPIVEELREPKHIPEKVVKESGPAKGGENIAAAILKKVLNITMKILAGIFIFYLFIAWVVIPLGLPWAIESQGSKFLKTPVVVRGAAFNPFLWRLSVTGLHILDTRKNDLVKFDRFSVDVSFLSLLKKIYHVESVDLDGLAIHASLVSAGRIDLMDLVPTVPAPAPVSPESITAPKAPEPLPLVLIDKINLTKGRIQFDDRTVSPMFTTALSDINVLVKGFSTKPDAITDVTFKAKLDEKGVMEAQAQVKPLMQPPELDLTFGLNEYTLTVLDPYVGKYTGRELQDGKLDVKVTYRIGGNQLTAAHKVLIQRFEFGKKVESKDALSLPFGLAVALLEDPQGRINISLPAKGDMSDPQFKYTHLIWQVVSNFFVKLMTKPFAILASVIGADSGTDELGYVRFLPGKQELPAEESAKLASLVTGLKDRPKLLLEINGSYDPQVDWKAIKTDIFEKDYTNLKGESTKLEEWVYQTLYQRRFGVMELWRLTRSFKTKGGGYDTRKMNDEIKRRLIEDAPPDKLALEVLAQSRAKVVYDGIIAAGLAENRVRIGNPRETQSSMGQVPLEFTLTVFDQPAATP